MQPANAFFECSGCDLPVETAKKSRSFREQLCQKCLDNWDALDAKANAYLKHLRAVGKHLE
jgi:hypothetical protein